MSQNQDLAEKDAIRELKARYFRHLDTKNWSEWKKIFTHDVAVTVDLVTSKLGEQAPLQQHIEGRDLFVSTQSEFLATVPTVHHGHMPEIALTGPDTATGVWSMEDIVELPDGMILRGYGHYHEEYKKQDGQWRIARMRLKRLRLDYIGAPPPTYEQLAANTR